MMDEYLGFFPGKESFLSAEEERELIALVQTENDSLALSRLVSSNMRFIASIAKKFTSSWRNKIPFEDACQEGAIGLMKAVERFDLSKGFALKTYSNHWIRNSIQRANVHYLAVYVPNRYLYESKDPTIRDEHKERAAIALSCRSASDVITDIDPDKKLSWESLFGSKDGDDSPLEFEEREILETRKQMVREWLADLEYKESKVIRGRFGFDGSKPKLLDEIGKDMGITKERVRQIEAKAMARLELGREDTTR